MDTDQKQIIITMEEIVDNLLDKLVKVESVFNDDSDSFYHRIFLTDEFKVFLLSAISNSNVFEAFLNKCLGSESIDNSILIRNFLSRLLRTYGKLHEDHGRFDTFVNYLFNTFSYKNYSFIINFFDGFTNNMKCYILANNLNTETFINRAIDTASSTYRLNFSEELCKILRIGDRRDEINNRINDSISKKNKITTNIKRKNESDKRAGELISHNGLRIKLKLTEDLFNSSGFIFAISILSYAGNDYYIHIIIASILLLFLSYNWYMKIMDKMKID